MFINGMADGAKHTSFARAVGRECRRVVIAGFVLFGLVGCEAAQPEATGEFREVLSLPHTEGAPGPVTHWVFGAMAADGTRIEHALEFSIEPHPPGGFDYCVKVFGNEVCGSSNAIWENVFGVALSLPCGETAKGILLAALRDEYVDDERVELETIWFSYVDGQVTSIQAETADELLPMFQCDPEAG